MSSEGKSDSIPESKEAKGSTKTSDGNKTKTENAADTEDDRGEDQLVIDEPDEKSDGDSDEKEFEPTIDMMLNDFDDEQTMEEEEANEDQENEEDELAALEQEQDMPIEELLKMYGAVPGGQEPEETPEESNESKSANDDKSPTSTSSSTQELTQPKTETPQSKPSSSNPPEATSEKEPTEGEMTSIKRRASPSPPLSAKKSKSELARFYEAAVEGRALRSQGSGQVEEAEEEEEEEAEDEENNENRDYSWKKTIMIGPSYQASVPLDLAAYGDTLPYGNSYKISFSHEFISFRHIKSHQQS